MVSLHTVMSTTSCQPHHESSCMEVNQSGNVRVCGWNHGGSHIFRGTGPVFRGFAPWSGKAAEKHWTRVYRELDGTLLEDEICGEGSVLQKHAKEKRNKRSRLAPDLCARDFWFDMGSIRWCVRAMQDRPWQNVMGTAAHRNAVQMLRLSCYAKAG